MKKMRIYDNDQLDAMKPKASADCLQRMVRCVRIMEQDHDPDGWPAVRMSDISELADAIQYCCAKLEYIAHSGLSARQLSEVALQALDVTSVKAPNAEVRDPAT